jgi:hypothetical protein
MGKVIMLRGRAVGAAPSEPGHDEQERRHSAMLKVHSDLLEASARLVELKSVLGRLHRLLVGGQK